MQAIDLSGGEPTLHPDFSSMLSQALEENYDRVSIATNLHKIDTLICVLKSCSSDFLKKIHLRVSFDGAFSSEYEWTRGKGSFKVFIKRLDQISKYVTPVSANTIVTKNSYNTIPNISYMAKQYGIKKGDVITF